jgi:hypothetical protein
MCASIAIAAFACTAALQGAVATACAHFVADSG